MTQKSAKKKSKKNSKSGAEASVLGNLRTTRPTRLGGERRAATPRSPAPTAKKAPKPRSSVAATKPAVPRTGSKKTSPGAAAQANATAAQRPAAPPPPPPAVNGRPKGTEIVTTAVQAAGELAQIGATVGSQLLKRAARRIPRP